MKLDYLALREICECSNLTYFGRKRVFFGTLLVLFEPNIVDDSQAYKQSLKTFQLLKVRADLREEYELLVDSSSVHR